MPEITRTGIHLNRDTQHPQMPRYGDTSTQPITEVTGGRGLQTNNGRGSLECVDWLLISLCHDKLLLETMNECDHYYQIKISVCIMIMTPTLHCQRQSFTITYFCFNISSVYFYFTHSTLIERPMI